MTSPTSREPRAGGRRAKVLAEITRACKAGDALLASDIARSIGLNRNRFLDLVWHLKCAGLISSEMRRGEMRYVLLATGEKTAWARWATGWTRGPLRRRLAVDSSTGGPATMRACMTCGEVFASTGINNRLCPAHTKARSTGLRSHGLREGLLR